MNCVLLPWGLFWSGILVELLQGQSSSAGLSMPCPSQERRQCPAQGCPLAGRTLSRGQLWQDSMPWHVPGWQFPCWAEMTIHISEQALCAAESGNHPWSLPPQLGAPGKAPATWCMTFPPFQLVLSTLAPGSCRNTSPGLVQGSQEAHLPKMAVSCPLAWGPSGCGWEAHTEAQTGAANRLLQPSTKN